MTDDLTALARAYGVQTSYRDPFGGRPQASTESLVAVLAGLGVDASSESLVREALAERRQTLEGPGLAPVTVVAAGSAGSVPLRVPMRAPPSAHCRLQEEGGAVAEWDVPLTPIGPGEEAAGSSFVAEVPLSALPIGYHTLELEIGKQRLSTTLIATPTHAAPWNRRTWGLFAPHYALRSQENAGIGDVVDLQALAKVVADLGGAVLATLPIVAPMLDTPFDPSPYAPSSRVAWSDLAVRIDTVDVAVAARLRETELVDYAAVAALKRAGLAEVARTARETSQWEQVQRFAREHPAMAEYARFRSVTARQQRSWRSWDAALIDGNFDGAYDPTQYDEHLYAQWLANSQVEALAASSRQRDVEIYLDFPVGVHPDGFDAWRHRAMFMDTCNVGAPPDKLFGGGQDWGFRPPDPEALRQAGYRPLIEALRHHMRVAGILRIDHVMGLHRLFCVPHGGSARDGAYLRYPYEELYAVVCVESHRSGVPVVGEDLGTVPGTVRSEMARHGLARMFVAQLEANDDDPPLSDPPPGSVASLNTHDLPPFAGFWAGVDLPSPADGGEPESEPATSRRRICQRLAEFSPGEDGRPPQTPVEVAASLNRHFAGTDASLVLLNIEDLWGETRSQNVPGTVDEHPNWRRKLRFSVDELAGLDAVAVLRDLAPIREKETP